MNINDPNPGRGLVVPFRKHKSAADPESQKADNYRVPGLGWLPDSIRNHFVAMSGEFTGTFLFLFFALSGTQVANTIPAVSGGATAQTTGANTSQLLYISLCFGFSLAVNAWVFFRISGGLFNPAVTLGMCLVGALPWFRGLLLFIAQIIGGICASAMVLTLFPGPLNVQTTLGGGTSIPQGLFIEMFLTAELVFTIFMLAAEKHRGTFIAPVGIGLSLFVAELTGVFFTGGSVNPARSFGPCVAASKFPSYHWIYWLGPILGSLLAAGFYKFIKMLEYETANPGQDEEDERHVPDPEKGAEQAKHPREYHDEHGNLAKDPEAGEQQQGQSQGGPDVRVYNQSPPPKHINAQYGDLPPGGLHGPDMHQKGHPTSVPFVKTTTKNGMGAEGAEGHIDGVMRQPSGRRRSIGRHPGEHARVNGPPTTSARHSDHPAAGVEEGTAAGMGGHRAIPPPATIPYQQRYDGHTAPYPMTPDTLPARASGDAHRDTAGRNKSDESGNSVGQGYASEEMTNGSHGGSMTGERGDRRSLGGGDKSLPFPPSVGRV